MNNNNNNIRELHDLLYSFMGMFHQKFLYRFRKDYEGPSDLKKNHMKIMNLIYQNQYLTSTEIGKMLDIEKGSLTTLIDQLAERDLVVRQNDATDRRKSLITLSEAGQAVMHQTMDFYTRQLNIFFQNVDPQELNKFIESLRYVVTFLKKM